MIEKKVESGKKKEIDDKSGVEGKKTKGKKGMRGGKEGIRGKKKIGEKEKIYEESGDMKDVEKNKTIFGSPALEHRHFLKSFAAFKRQGK